MGQVTAEISASLDGYVAGPNQTLEEPLGAGGEKLHEWVFRLKTFREMHGMEGGETGPDDDLVAESVRATGAVVMGRRMFSGGAGPWEEDPNADGWWGDDPPFHVPVFVVTHHAGEPVEMQGGTTFHFVTDSVESAVEQAKAAAGGQNVSVGGGGNVIQQCIEAGLLDEIQIHLVPILLGDGGVPLFENVRARELERVDEASSPTGVTHLRFRVPN